MLVWVGVLNRQQGLPAGFMQQVMRCSTQKMQDFSGDQVSLSCVCGGLLHLQGLG
jgi:hypothetical protein